MICEDELRYDVEAIEQLRGDFDGGFGFWQIFQLAEHDAIRPATTLPGLTHGEPDRTIVLGEG